MNLLGVMIMMQMLGGNHPEVRTSVYAVMPIEECEAQATSMNANIPMRNFTHDGVPILMEKRQCAFIDQRQLDDGMEKMGWK